MESISIAKEICLGCDDVKELSTYPFCNTSCKINYLCRLEYYSYVQGKMKYVEFDEELRVWLKQGFFTNKMIESKYMAKNKGLKVPKAPPKSWA